MGETISVFQWVANLSPWWWVAFGIALGAVEMATMSFFLIWPALGAVVMAVIVAVAPPMPGEMLVSLWAILSVALTFAGRSMMHRFGDGGEPVTALNNRAKQLIGRQAKVISWEHGEGAVEIDGMRWRAVAPNGASFISDTPVNIIKADGMTLTVTSGSS